MNSPQHQNSQQSAGQNSPWPPSNISPLSSLYANQQDFSSQLQVQKLHQDLAHVQKQIQEYQDLIASLYTAIHNIENKICVNCRTHFEKYAPVMGLATSSTVRAVTVSPSSKLKFSLPRSPTSNRIPLWHRVFKSHSRPSHSASSDIPGGSGLLRRSNVKASDFTQPNRSVSVSPESILPSISVTQVPISPETSTYPKDVHIPNHLDWSVDFDSNVKPGLKVKLEHVLTPGAVVGRVKFSPDGKYLAVGVDSGRTYIYDVKTGAKSCFLFDNSERSIWCLCFSLDGKYLAVGHFDGQLRIWEIAKKRTRNIFRQDTDIIRDLDFSPDGHFLVSCSFDETLRIWSMRDGFLKLLEDKSAVSFHSVKFHPDGRHIAAGDEDGMLRIWNVRTSQLVEKWTAHGNVVRSVVFTLDGKGLVSSSGDHTWKYWDMSLLELVEPGYGMTKDSIARQKSEVTAHTNDIRSIAVSPDGQWVVSGSGDRTVRIWNLHNAARQCTLRGCRDAVWSVDFCPTGTYLASGGADGQVVLWRYEAV